MEILIIGGVVVLIMVIISTQIKKGVARAYDREVIETPYYRLVKPDGFIYPIHETSEYAFEAYSKAYGERRERNTWRAQAYLTVFDDLVFDAELEKIRLETGEIISEKIISEASSDEKALLMQSTVIIDEKEFNEFHKIVESRRQNKTYDLKILVLKNYREEFLGRVDELVNSFQLK